VLGVCGVGLLCVHGSTNCGNSSVFDCRVSSLCILCKMSCVSVSFVLRCCVFVVGLLLVGAVCGCGFWGFGVGLVGVVREVGRVVLLVLGVGLWFGCVVWFGCVGCFCF